MGLFDRNRVSVSYAFCFEISTIRSLYLSGVFCYNDQIKIKNKNMKHSMRHLTKVTFFALFLLFFAFGGKGFALQDMQFSAFSKDTLAGYSTFLESSSLPPGQDIVFQVKKPDGTVVNFPVSVDHSGVARQEFPAPQTYQAGAYFVRIVLSGVTSKATSFMVYPQKVALEKSNFSLNRTFARADGHDVMRLTVVLRDRYGNALDADHVGLVSDRLEDKIQKVQADTAQADGQVNFVISSSRPGKATLRVTDTLKNSLFKSVQVAFLAQDYKVDGLDAMILGGGGSTSLSFDQNLPSNIGGDFDFHLFDTAFAASGSLHHFTLSDFPSTVQVGQNVSFRVTAQDENNQTVQNYVGKVHFSAEGNNSNNISLPEDYVFKVDDLGTHLYSLGLSFPTAGDYKIVVTDMENPLIRGEKTVTVTGGLAGSSGQQNAQLKPVIELPTAGTYSQKIQTVSGLAPAGYTVKIFDHQQEIGAVQATADGKFSYQTTSLKEGVHKIYVVAIDASQAVKGTSDTIEFTVDSAPPEVEDITLQPTSGIKAGQVITINVTSEENLSQVAVVFNKDLVQLNPSLDQPGHYINSVSAPKESGVYPVDVYLVDQLGNEASYKAKAQVTVSDSGGTASVTSSQETQQSTSGVPFDTQQTQILSSTPPSDVSGLLSYADDQRVVLVWDAATDDTLVKHYRVYFGTDPGNLDIYVDTFDASATWYVPNLKNGQEYYFAVTAFDDQEMESVRKSVVITGIPFKSETSGLPKPDVSLSTQEVLHGASPEELHQAANDAISGHKPGSEIIWLLSGSGLLSTLAYQIKRRLKH